VLDLSRLLPGPLCSLILAELGAEVVKIEDPGGGDYLRLMPPLKQGMGGAFYALNRGKRSVVLDLKKPAARNALLRLLPRSDVVLESFRPGVMERLGLGYPVLAAANPRVILCSISGYGQTGPLRERAGHDIDYLALSGALAAGGTPSGAPALPGIQVADLAGGSLWAAVRILAALRTGEGAHLDVSMTEGVLAFMLPWLGDLAFGAPPLRRGEGTLNGGFAGYGTYHTAGDGHVAVGALEPKFWAGLCRALGRPCDLADLVAAAPRQHALRDELQARFGGATRDEWAERLAPADVCTEPVLEIEELEAHPQHRARGVFHTALDPERGPITLPRLPLGGEPATTPAPKLGEHTEEVLREAGFTEEELARLLAEGAMR
jgi:crotonobetainyl-CoA:carnitine CoA-transferase CaiB-like acyl-CoA transferase